MEDEKSKFDSRFSFDQIEGVVQLFDTLILVAIGRSELDLNAVAAHVLRSRGMDKNGAWIGFKLEVKK